MNKLLVMPTFIVMSRLPRLATIDIGPIGPSLPAKIGLMSL